MSSLTALRLVHPRLRGELFDFFNVRWLNNGSSPLTRGTHTFIFCQLGGRRFIPAYAGNSHDSRAVNSNGTVHPRLRGELRLSLFPESKKIGSSPLTRGTHSCSKACSNSYRFIPAYAGNSLGDSAHGFNKSVHPRLRGELHKRISATDGHCGSSPLTRGTHLKTV